MNTSKTESWSSFSLWTYNLWWIPTQIQRHLWLVLAFSAWFKGDELAWKLNTAACLFKEGIEVTLDWSYWGGPNRLTAGFLVQQGQEKALQCLSILFHSLASLSLTRLVKMYVTMQAAHTDILSTPDRPTHPQIHGRLRIGHKKGLSVGVPSKMHHHRQGETELSHHSIKSVIHRSRYSC